MRRTAYDISPLRRAPTEVCEGRLYAVVPTRLQLGGVTISLTTVYHMIGKLRNSPAAGDTVHIQWGVSCAYFYEE